MGFNGISDYPYVIEFKKKIAMMIMKTTPFIIVINKDQSRYHLANK